MAHIATSYIRSIQASEKILSIIAQSSSMTTEDFIKRTCGGLLFMYYAYVDRLHVRPVDMNDMIDGLLYLDAKSYITKQTVAAKSKDQK